MCVLYLQPQQMQPPQSMQYNMAQQHLAQQGLNAAQWKNFQSVCKRRGFDGSC